MRRFLIPVCIILGILCGIVSTYAMPVRSKRELTELCAAMDRAGIRGEYRLGSNDCSNVSARLWQALHDAGYQAFICVGWLQQPYKSGDIYSIDYKAVRHAMVLVFVAVDGGYEPVWVEPTTMRLSDNARGFLVERIFERLEDARKAYAGDFAVEMAEEERER